MRPVSRAIPVPSEGRADFDISPRAISLLVLFAIAAALLCRFLDPEHAWTAALKTVSATVVIGVVPGVLMTLLWRPRQTSVLELVGFGIAISFGVAQVLTVLAVSAHLSPVVMLIMLLAVSVLAASRVIWRGTGSITVGVDDVIVIAFVLALSWSAYAVGAPVDSQEDQIHAAIARRLSQLDSPQLDNLYVTPGIVYTYPFPGTHYFMGLIARLGEIDALFLYHKIRFFWGLTSLLMIYLAACAVFGTRGVASAVTVTAVMLVWSGVFALGFTTGWGNLVPYSHASDIAMSVLLPCLLVSSFWYLQAESTRERGFFGTATGLLVLMLTMVHMREVVQFAAYLGCFAVVAAISRDFRPYLLRTVGLLVLTIGCAALYTAWQGSVAPFVQDIVDTHRAELVAIAGGSSLRGVLLEPASTLLANFVPKLEEMFNGLMPFFLFGGPAVVLLFRHRPLVWLIASSIAAYLAVMSVPLLAIPYVYATYFEILHLPVRNIIFFVYLLSGALLYAGVVGLARVDRTRLSPIMAGTLGGALALLTILCLNRSHSRFFVPLIAAYGMTFLCLREGALMHGKRMRAAVIAGVSLAGFFMLWPDHPAVPRSEQVTVRWRSDLPAERRAAFEQRFSLGQGERKPDETPDVNVWNYRVTDLSVDNMRGIVTHPDVVDTHFIDRSSFRVESQPPPGDRLPLGVRYVSWIQYPGMPLLIATAVLIWVLGFLVPAALASGRGRESLASLVAALRLPFYRQALPYALFIIPFALWSARPEVWPLTMALAQPAGQWDTPRRMIEQLPCVTSPPTQARFTEHLFPDDQVMLPERTA